MTEIGEIIAVAVEHSSDNEHCPFCPMEPPPEFKTYPGLANDSDKLGDIMEKPVSLLDKQPSARPKNSEKNQQEKSDQQEKPMPIFLDDEEGPYSCEAHHLISGKHALASENHNFEQWILAAKGTIEKDTGYSVNNADNGIWAPSIPEKYRNGKWGPMSFAMKYEIAKKPMAAGLPQFHIGNHLITDRNDSNPIKHESYNTYLINMLKAMDDRMRGWANVCPLTDNGKKKLYQPSVRANQVLDKLSKVVRKKISAPATTWNIFLSKYALNFHNEGKRPEKQIEE